MQKRARRDDDGRAIGMMDGGAVLHDRADVHHVLALGVDRTAQQPDKSLVRHDLLRDGVDQKSCIDKGLAGAFPVNGAFRQFGEGYAAGRLILDATLNFPYQ